MLHTSEIIIKFVEPADLLRAARWYHWEHGAPVQITPSLQFAGGAKGDKVTTAGAHSLKFQGDYFIKTLGQRVHRFPLKAGTNL